MQIIPAPTPSSCLNGTQENTSITVSSKKYQAKKHTHTHKYKKHTTWHLPVTTPNCLLKASLKSNLQIKYPTFSIAKRPEANLFLTQCICAERDAKTRWKDQDSPITCCGTVGRERGPVVIDVGDPDDKVSDAVGRDHQALVKGSLHAGGSGCAQHLHTNQVLLLDLIAHYLFGFNRAIEEDFERTTVIVPACGQMCIYICCSLWVSYTCLIKVDNMRRPINGDRINN